MLKLGFNDYDAFEAELDSPVKYTFQMISKGFKEKVPGVHNTATAEVFKKKYMDKFSKDETLARIYDSQLKKMYGKDVEFVKIHDVQFKRNNLLFFFLFETTEPMTCRELDDRFGDEGIFYSYGPIKVTGIYEPVTSSKKCGTKYPQGYVKASSDMHYMKPSRYGGFTLDGVTNIAQLDSLVSKFDKVIGNINEGRYAAICNRSTISSTFFDTVLFTDDLEEAKQFVAEWLDPETHAIGSPYGASHYYGAVIDLEDQVEIAYGDAWQRIRYEDGEVISEPGWEQFYI